MWHFVDFIGLKLEIVAKETTCSHSYFYLRFPLANRMFKHSGTPSLNNFVSNSPRWHSLHGGIQFSTVMMLPEETHKRSRRHATLFRTCVRASYFRAGNGKHLIRWLTSNFRLSCCWKLAYFRFVSVELFDGRIGIASIVRCVLTSRWFHSRDIEAVADTWTDEFAERLIPERNDAVLKI